MGILLERQEYDSINRRVTQNRRSMPGSSCCRGQNRRSWLHLGESPSAVLASISSGQRKKSRGLIVANGSLLKWRTFAHSVVDCITLQLRPKSKGTRVRGRGYGHVHEDLRVLILFVFVQGLNPVQHGISNMKLLLLMAMLLTLTACQSPGRFQAPQDSDVPIHHD